LVMRCNKFASHHLYVADLDDEKNEYTKVTDKELHTPGGFTKQTSLSSLDATNVESETAGVPLTNVVALNYVDSTPHLHLLVAESQPTDEMVILPGQISDD